MSDTQESQPEVKYVPLDSVVPYENNPRLNEDAVAGVRESIKEFGFNVPLVVDANMVIITGHTRRLAALELGLKNVPVIVASHLNEAQVAAFRLADNRLSENAKWDESKLSSELQYIQNMGFSLEFTGFTKSELDCLCGTVTADCLSEVNYEAVCGEVVEASAQESLSVLFSAGSYRFRISMEEFRAWEEMMLSDFGKAQDISNFMRKALRVDEALIKMAEAAKEQVH